MIFKLSRRTWLRAAAGTLALPWLPSLSRGDETSGPPLRLVLFFHPNGTVGENLWPTSTSETEFELPAILTPFAPYRDRLLLAKGINSTVAIDPNNRGGPHQRGMGAVFTGQMLLEGEFLDGCGSAAGWADGPSVDQVVAQHIGRETAFSSLELGVRATIQDVQGRISYLASGAPLPAISDPVALYERLFHREISLDPSDPNSKARAVLDSSKSQLALLHKRVGAEDRLTLEHHLSLVEDLERRMSIQAATCTDLSAPPQLEVDSENTMPDISRNHLDLLAHALSCDLTRVASVQYSTGFNQIRFPWLDTEGEGHALSHSGDSSTDAWTAMTNRVRWHAEEIAYFMGKLASMPEGDGSVLDSTVVLWSSEISRGNSHSLYDIPYVLLGNARGAIRTGRSLTYEGASNCDFLHAVLAAFGVDVPTFGHPDHAHGILSGIVS